MKKTKIIIKLLKHINSIKTLCVVVLIWFPPINHQKDNFNLAFRWIYAIKRGCLYVKWHFRNLELTTQTYLPILCANITQLFIKSKWDYTNWVNFFFFGDAIMAKIWYKFPYPPNVTTWWPFHTSTTKQFMQIFGGCLFMSWLGGPWVFFSSLKAKYSKMKKLLEFYYNL